MSAKPESVEFDVIHDGTESPYDDSTNAAQDVGTEDDA
jgi:hypothetical protein